MLEDALEPPGHRVADGRVGGRRRAGGGGALAAADERVERVVICTPDKDLGQCVIDGKVVQLDRRQDKWFDEAGCIGSSGSPGLDPRLARARRRQRRRLPGPPRLGGASRQLRCSPQWGHLEEIPADPIDWDANVRGASKLNLTLRQQCGPRPALPAHRHRRAGLRRRRGRRLGVDRSHRLRALAELCGARGGGAARRSRRSALRSLLTRPPSVEPA